MFFHKTSEDEEHKEQPVWVSFPVDKRQKETSAANLEKKLSQVFTEYYGEIPPNKNYFIVNGSVELDDEPVVVPTVQVIFR